MHAKMLCIYNHSTFTFSHVADAFFPKRLPNHDNRVLELEGQIKMEEMCFQPFLEDDSAVHLQNASF